MNQRIAYLGPAGAHPEAALRTQKDLLDAESLPFDSIAAAVEAVEEDDAELAFVPMDGHGGLLHYHTLEHLAYHTNLLIRREILHPLTFHLVAKRANAALNEIKTLAAPAHVRPVCRQAVAKLLGHDNVTWIPTLSTPDALRLVEQGHAQSALAMSRLDPGELVVLREDILARPEGEADVRYALVGHGIPARSGSDRTSIVCFMEKDQPGSLGHILQEFSVRGLNLTRVESRPSRSHMGDYSFFIDIEGHINDPLVLEALKGLRFRLREVKFLGSYPAARPTPSRTERKVAAARAEAERWIDYLTAMVD